MAERHKREAKLNRGRKAKNKGREVLPNTKKSTSTEVINQEHKEIIKWFQTVSSAGRYLEAWMRMMSGRSSRS